MCIVINIVNNKIRGDYTSKLEKPGKSETLLRSWLGRNRDIKNYTQITIRGIQKVTSETESGWFFNPFYRSHRTSAEVGSHMPNDDYIDCRHVKSE